MNDDDLIRRGDALEAIAAVLAQRSGNDDFGNIMRDVRLQNEADQDAIRAIPAAARERDALRAALEPFRELMVWTETAEDDQIVLVSVGTVRKARAALEGPHE